MSKGITSEVIAEVRNRASLLDIVSEAVVLKRSGKEHKGLCPFHNEKTPSFHVNTEKGIYKCFGCGEGGDVFAFVQKVKNLDFLDAVKELAYKYGVTLAETTEDRQAYDRRSLHLLLYQQASQYYSKLLHDPATGQVARDYLEKRGISDELIEKFQLGYAPALWDGLLRHLSYANKVTPQSLEEAGLTRRKTGGDSYFDLFRNRLIIPICDEQARVIAFGGRTLGDDQVKYLNSPETAIYTKGQHLFAFHLAKEAIKERDSVIVVEGYFDALTLHQYGFTNTVAALGTALTAQQAKTLVRYTESKRVYIAFDADNAGQRAMERGVETLTQVAEGVGIELRVVTIPDGKDPDECLRSPSGSETFTKALAEAPLLLDYRLAAAIGSISALSHTGKIEAAKRVLPLLAEILHAVARGEYIRQIALRLKVREEELLSDVSQYRQEHRLSARSPGYSLNIPTKQRSTPQNSLIDGTIDAEQRILALFLSSREDYQQAKDSVYDEEFINSTHLRIKQAIDGIGPSFNNMHDLQYKLLDRLGGDEEAKAALIEVILKSEHMKKQDTACDLVLRQSRLRLLQEKLRRNTRQLSEALAQSVQESTQSSLQSRISELKRLETVIMPTISSLSELEALKNKIDELTNLADIPLLTETRT